MWDAERNGPHTAHTTNPVPVLLIGPDVKVDMPLSDGSLRDVAPTMLGVLGIAPPPDMTGTRSAPLAGVERDSRSQSAS